MPLSGREKATILLSILGVNTSAKILERLPDEIADFLAAGVNDLPKPSPDAISRVLAEFRQFVALPSAPRPPAIEGAVPSAGSQARPREAQPSSGKPRDIISRVPGRVLIPILLRERPQTIAFVLGELPQARVAEILTYLPEQRREVEYLLNTINKNPLTEKIKGDVLEYVAKKLS